MKVISLPKPLARAIALLFLCIPLAAFECFLVTRASWWRLPLQPLGLWSAVAAFFVIGLAAALSRGRTWAWDFGVFLSVVWCASTAWAAARFGLPALGFLAIFQLLFLGMLLLWIHRELGRSYFDPGLRWFQGVPEPISFLKCDVLSPASTGTAELRVSRLDHDGAFVFGSAADRLMTSGLGSSFDSHAAHELVFRFRDRQVRCRGVPMRYFRRSVSGAGFRFQGLSLDTRKQLGDFIEMLRGEGYVE